MLAVEALRDVDMEHRLGDEDVEAARYLLPE